MADFPIRVHIANYWEVIGKKGVDYVLLLGTRSGCGSDTLIISTCVSRHGQLSTYHILARARL